MEANAIEWDMMDAYKKIYTSGAPVWKATIVAHARPVDPYGNESIGPIYRTEMDAVTARQINWDNHRGVNAPQVLDIIYIAPSVR